MPTIYLKGRTTQHKNTAGFEWLAKKSHRIALSGIHHNFKWYIGSPFLNLCPSERDEKEKWMAAFGVCPCTNSQLIWFMELVMFELSSLPSCHCGKLKQFSSFIRSLVQFTELHLLQSPRKEGHRTKNISWSVTEN